MSNLPAQCDNGGAFCGFTASGDATINTLGEQFGDPRSLRTISTYTIAVRALNAVAFDNDDAVRHHLQREFIAMSKKTGLLAALRKWLRRVAPTITFVVYISIATGHFCRVDNPRVGGGMHIAAAVAHLL
jgi:hypothetical protein